MKDYKLIISQNTADIQNLECDLFHLEKYAPASLLLFKPIIDKLKLLDQTNINGIINDSIINNQASNQTIINGNKIITNVNRLTELYNKMLTDVIKFKTVSALYRSICLKCTFTRAKLAGDKKGIKRLVTIRKEAKIIYMDLRNKYIDKINDKRKVIEKKQRLIDTVAKKMSESLASKK